MSQGWRGASYMYLVRNAGWALPLGVEEVHEPGLEGGELPVQLGGHLDEQVVFPLQQQRTINFIFIKQPTKTTLTERQVSDLPTNNKILTGLRGIFRFF